MKRGESPLMIMLDGMVFYVIRINKNTFFNVGKFLKCRHSGESRIGVRDGRRNTVFSIYSRHRLAPA